MAGPIVHTIAIKQTDHYLRKDGIKLNESIDNSIIAAYKAILPDIEKVHAYWIPKTGTGNLWQRIKYVMSGLSYAPGTYHFDNAVFRICHYVVDCHTIGHFLGSKIIDMVCEPIGELIKKKDSFPISICSKCSSFDEWLNSLYESITMSYHDYGKGYLLHIGPAVRRSVRAGREFTVELVRLVNDKKTN